MESSGDKLSIKTLLFAKAIPNYVLPVPTDGHKVFGCVDCGDRFIFESSYEQHINRKSVKISYTCRNHNCSNLKIFYNRCKLLAHIRSHNFKTATINVSDLKIEPLPITEFNMSLVGLVKPNDASSSGKRKTDETVVNTISCHECELVLKPTKKDQTVDTILAYHYQHNEAKVEVYTCPVCIFALPTVCALKSHLRMHLRCPPYVCPECGVKLTAQSTNYPYSHNCEGFRMMRVTARVNCPMPNCYLCHPNELKAHIKQNHLKMVFKCPFCFVACFSEPIIEKHMKSHAESSKPFIFYQCEMCPGRLVLQDTLDNHLKGHEQNSSMFPCWACGSIFQDVPALIKHHTVTHDANQVITKTCREISKIPNPSSKNKRIYRVIKRCDQCKKSYNYRCSFEQIKMLPNECPSKCTSSNMESYKQITCGMCKNKMRQNWDDIKKHFSMYHKNHRCLDLNVVIAPFKTKKCKVQKQRKHFAKQKSFKKQKNNKDESQNDKTNSSKIIIPTRTDCTQSGSGNQYACIKCAQNHETEKELEAHLITHRDPCMAYQCMECGQCFVVKPTFSKHLLLEHDITDIESYITRKGCYNESALMKYQSNAIKSDEPLRDNQCKICRQQFDNGSDLEKHFRVHGMAFLMEKTCSKNSP